MDRRLLVPQYVKEFTCIGTDCEDSCCSVGWSIDIDFKTYKKYKDLKKSHPLKKEIDKSFIRNRGTTSDSNYAKIKLKKDGSCPLLNEKKLCSIHNQLGEEYLSYTCKVYPRFVNLVDERVEVSLTTSCPEAARMALLNPNLMAFDEIGDDELSYQLAKHQVITKPKGENHINYYFWDLRIFTISLLQNRNFTMDERLILLGMFYNKVQLLIKNEELSKIHTLIKETKEGIDTGKVRQGLSKIPSSNEIQLELVKSIISSNRAIKEERFSQCLNDFIEGLKINGLETQESENIVSQFEHCYKEYYQPHFNQYHFILENYLVNYVYKNMFPLNQGLDVFRAFCLLTIKYSIIKLLLIGISGFYKGLNNDIIIKVIQSFSKVIEHNGPFLDNLLKQMEEKEYLTMGYMVILIKN